MTAYEVLKSVLIVAIALNIFVSVKVAICDYYSAGQNVFQIAIIWLFPVLGAVLFGLFLAAQSGGGARTGYRSNVEDDTQTWSALLHKDHSSEE